MVHYFCTSLLTQETSNVELALSIKKEKMLKHGLPITGNNLLLVLNITRIDLMVRNFISGE
jgi:hypothetical protein